MMLEIHKKEDILIPFTIIGEEHWEVNARTILEAVADNWNDELKEPVREEEINALEQRLGTALPHGLRLFYRTFGISDIGEQLQRFDEISFIKEIWAEHPQYAPDFTEKDREYLPFLISFSDYLGNGNMFCFHSETKEIYYYDHEGSPYLSKMFENVDQYLRCCLISAQSDLFGTDTGEEKVAVWTEEILTDLLGEDLVRKWKY